MSTATSKLDYFKKLENPEWVKERYKPSVSNKRSPSSKSANSKQKDGFTKNASRLRRKAKEAMKDISGDVGIEFSLAGKASSSQKSTAKKALGNSSQYSTAKKPPENKISSPRNNATNDRNDKVSSSRSNTATNFLKGKTTSLRSSTTMKTSDNGVSLRSSAATKASKRKSSGRRSSTLIKALSDKMSRPRSKATMKDLMKKTSSPRGKATMNDRMEKTSSPRGKATIIDLMEKNSSPRSNAATKVLENIERKAVKESLLASSGFSPQKKAAEGLSETKAEKKIRAKKEIEIEPVLATRTIDLWGVRLLSRKGSSPGDEPIQAPAKNKKSIRPEEPGASNPSRSRRMSMNGETRPTRSPRTSVARAPGGNRMDDTEKKRSPRTSVPPWAPGANRKDNTEKKRMKRKKEGSTKMGPTEQNGENDSRKVPAKSLHSKKDSPTSRRDSFSRSKDEARNDALKDKLEAGETMRKDKVEEVKAKATKNRPPQQSATASIDEIIANVKLVKQTIEERRLVVREPHRAEQEAENDVSSGTEKACSKTLMLENIKALNAAANATKLRQAALKQLQGVIDHKMKTDPAAAECHDIIGEKVELRQLSTKTDVILNRLHDRSKLLKEKLFAHLSAEADELLHDYDEDTKMELDLTENEQAFLAFQKKTLEGRWFSARGKSTPGNPKNAMRAVRARPYSIRKALGSPPDVSQPTTQRDAVSATQQLVKEECSRLRFSPERFKILPDHLRRNRKVVIAAVSDPALDVRPLLSVAPLSCNRKITEIIASFLRESIENRKARTENLKYASPSLRADPEVVLAAVSYNGFALSHADKDLQTDRSIVLAAVQRTGEVLQHLSTNLRDDSLVVMAAVHQNGCALRWASEGLQDTPSVVLAAVQQNGDALRWSSPKLRGTRMVVATALKKGCHVLQFASDELRGDKDILSSLLKHSGEALKYATAELQGDSDFALFALGCDMTAFSYISKKLQIDQSFLVRAIQSGVLAFESVSNEMKNDRLTALEAVARDGKCLSIAGNKLRNNREFTIAAMSRNGLALEFADTRFQNDREVVVTAIKSDSLAIKLASDRMAKQLIEHYIALLSKSSQLERADHPGSHPKPILATVIPQKNALAKDTVAPSSLITPSAHAEEVDASASPEVASSSLSAPNLQITKTEAAQFNAPNLQTTRTEAAKTVRAEPLKPAKAEPLQPAEVETPKPARVDPPKPARADPSKPAKADPPKPAEPEAPKPMEAETLKSAQTDPLKLVEPETPEFIGSEVPTSTETGPRTSLWIREHAPIISRKSSLLSSEQMETPEATQPETSWFALKSVKDFYRSRRKIAARKGSGSDLESELKIMNIRWMSKRKTANGGRALGSPSKAQEVADPLPQRDSTSFGWMSKRKSLGSEHLGEMSGARSSRNFEWETRIRSSPDLSVTEKKILIARRQAEAAARAHEAAPDKDAVSRVKQPAKLQASEAEQWEARIRSTSDLSADEKKILIDRKRAETSTQAQASPTMSPLQLGSRQNDTTAPSIDKKDVGEARERAMMSGLSEEEKDFLMAKRRQNMTHRSNGALSSATGRSEEEERAIMTGVSEEEINILLAKRENSANSSQNQAAVPNPSSQIQRPASLNEIELPKISKRSETVPALLSPNSKSASPKGTGSAAEARATMTGLSEDEKNFVLNKRRQARRVAIDSDPRGEDGKATLAMKVSGDDERKMTGGPLKKTGESSETAMRAAAGVPGSEQKRSTHESPSTNLSQSQRSNQIHEHSTKLKPLVSPTVNTPTGVTLTTKAAPLPDASGLGFPQLVEAPSASSSVSSSSSTKHESTLGAGEHAPPAPGSPKNTRSSLAVSDAYIMARKNSMGFEAPVRKSFRDSVEEAEAIIKARRKSLLDKGLGDGIETRQLMAAEAQSLSEEYIQAKRRSLLQKIQRNLPSDTDVPSGMFKFSIHRKSPEDRDTRSQQNFIQARRQSLLKKLQGSAAGVDAGLGSGSAKGSSANDKAGGGQGYLQARRRSLLLKIQQSSYVQGQNSATPMLTNRESSRLMKNSNGHFDVKGAVPTNFLKPSRNASNKASATSTKPRGSNVNDDPRDSVEGYIQARRRSLLEKLKLAAP